ncbi:MAG: Holliday junction branch migration protein RuvA, partial [Phascolarctobacterium sp.]|nr:Holliday junction branch migration protein RuvA [Phascolarctobacterium sp.]
VSGVGPKMALGILSAIKPDAFYLAVQSRDVKTLTKLPGIGKKTAERMLLELKDKVGAATGEVGSDFGESVAAGGCGAVAEAMEALASLGYSNSEIMPVLKQIPNADKLSGEEVLRQALKLFAKR